MLIPAVVISALYSQQQQGLEFIKQSQLARNLYSIPRFVYRVPSKIITGSIKYRFSSSVVPDSQEMYSDLFYKRYCPKSDFSSANTSHSFKNDKCTRCGYNPKQSEEFKPETSNIYEQYISILNAGHKKEDYQVAIPRNNLVDDMIKQLYS